MYYISSFILIFQWFKSNAPLDKVYFSSFSYTVSIRFDDFSGTSVMSLAE